MGGEQKRKRSATAKLISLYPTCCYCAGQRPSSEREHMPPKSFFDGSFRPDKLVMPACTECNRGSSSADLVAAIVSRFGYDLSETELYDYRRLLRRLEIQSPDIIEELRSGVGLAKNLRGRKHLEKHGVFAPAGARTIAIGRLVIRQLNLFAHKATLALYFEHFRRPLGKNAAYHATWRTKEDFAARGFPNPLLDMLPKYATLEQGQWRTDDTFGYRFDLNRELGLSGFFASIRSRLYLAGFVVEDADQVASDSGWRKSDDLLKLMHEEAFESRRD